MNINLLPPAVLEWLKSQGSALLQPGKAPPPPSFESGKAYQALVLSSLANGRYIVQVNEQLLDMSLPRTARQGDTLSLTYLKAQPRATFLLTSPPPEIPGRDEGGSPQPVRLSEGAGKIAALAGWAIKQAATAPGNVLPTVAAQPAATPIASGVSAGASPTAAAARPTTTPAQSGVNPVATAANAALATAGRAIAVLPTGAPPTAAPPTPAAAPAQAAPVQQTVAGPAPGAAPAAQAAVQYPAAATVIPNPGRPLPAALLTMPGANVQAGVLSSVVMPTVPASNPAPAGAHLTTPLISHQAAEQPQAWLAPLRQAVKESGMFYEANLQRWAGGQQGLAEVQRQPQAALTQTVAAAQGVQVAELDGMHEDVARLAGRQLQMLEGQPFVWQGLAWPGQWLEWQIEERNGDGNGRGDPEETPWRTQLRLRLPRLGGLFAELDLAPHGLKLRLAADSEATLAELRAALPQLTGRLDASGLAVLGVAIEPAKTDAAGAADGR